jgi:AcrR family transcriptional regulator
MAELTQTRIRSDNRMADILDSAARQFAHRGYAATSMRAIADEANMLPGSLYYHFRSKEQLLVAVYEAGVEELCRSAHAAMETCQDPWDRLEALCRAHVETVLRDSDYAHVLIRVLPSETPKAASELQSLRRRFEDIYRSAVADLALSPGSDSRAIRLLLMGALNWAAIWYTDGGPYTPQDIARAFVKLVKERQDAETTP